LSTQQDGRVLTVEFTNPPRNFFDERMGIELVALVREVDRDPSLGAVIFTGRDRWVTHYSVPELVRAVRSAPFPMSYLQARAGGVVARALTRVGPLPRALRRTPLRGVITPLRLYEIFARMNASDKVYIAAVNGVALGMGMILALACDLRLMSDGEDHAMGLIETRVSLLGALGGTQRLVRMVGQSRAAELLLEGRYLNPAEAAEMGLVHRVVPERDLQDEALALAARLAGRSPVVNREIKRMLYDAGARPFGRALRMEGASLVAVSSRPRAAQEMERYLAKLPRADGASDRDILNAWDEMLAAAPPAAERAEVA
jgi:enoyl-CoA hydratase/carnithine racemase